MGFEFFFFIFHRINATKKNDSGEKTRIQLFSVQITLERRISTPQRRLERKDERCWLGREKSGGGVECDDDDVDDELAFFVVLHAFFAAPSDLPSRAAHRPLRLPSESYIDNARVDGGDGERHRR